MKFLFLLACCNLFGSLPLLEDYHKALVIAELYEKPIAVILGSLDEVVKDPLFADAVGSEFIFVRLPGSAPATIVLLDKEEREITSVGYQGESAEELAKFLKGRLIKYYELLRDYEKGEGLEALYEKAVELGSFFYREKILEKGLALQEGVFFLLEKYASFVNLGEKDLDEAKQIREQIIARDPYNHTGARLRLALIDFQENHGKPEEVVAPLRAYIKEFGEVDSENLLKLNRILEAYGQG